MTYVKKNKPKSVLIRQIWSRLSEEEDKALTRAAKKEGVTKSQYIRKKILESL